MGKQCRRSGEETCRAVVKKSMYRVASVPYINARPLVLGLERFGWAEVSYAVPSSLPAILDSGHADVVMVSSFDALRTPNRTIAAGCSVATLGAVDSVRLFSKTPFDAIKTLALDQSSLTSNHLARCLLAEIYGIRPETTPELPDLAVMLEDHDACILIGDKGFEADGTGLHVMDLGSVWREWSGKPFVWAVWVGTQALGSDLVSILNRAKRWGLENLHEVVEDTMNRVGWSHEVAEHYLARTMNYDLSDAHLEGMELFRRLLVKHGFIIDQPFPRCVSSDVAVSL